jgi:hypothetical protein
LGETCYNVTTFPYVQKTSQCGPFAYCPYFGGSVAVCTAQKALGAACSSFYTSSSNSECQPTATCDYSYTQVCVAFLPRFHIAGGAAANYSWQCNSGLLNTTSRTCIDYAVSLAEYQSKSGQDCSNDEYCGAVGDCACRTGGISGARCVQAYLRSPSEQQAEFNNQLSRRQTLSDAGCTPSIYVPEPGTQTSDYCVVRTGLFSSLISTLCTQYRHIVNTGIFFPDCGSYAHYCGAPHASAVSIMLLVSLAIAALLAPLF